MTVAAVIFASTQASALADTDGTPGVRRLADAAWAGGATPVVVCAPDDDGALAAALANAEATLVTPGATGAGPVGLIAGGIDAAIGLVAGTDAALVWPARQSWVDAETVTTLIQAHGDDREPVLRPSFAGEAGFPVLVPVRHLATLRALAADRTPAELLDDLAAAGIPVRLVETGDPGVTHDASVPRDALPPFDGPPEPADGLPREWGAPAADVPDDAPVTGPSRLDPTRPAG
jgi:CTP:molybdopterin cytidylyltransferase MocA